MLTGVCLFRCINIIFINYKSETLPAVACTVEVTMYGKVVEFMNTW